MRIVRRTLSIVTAVSLVLFSFKPVFCQDLSLLDQEVGGSGEGLDGGTAAEPVSDPELTWNFRPTGPVVEVKSYSPNLDGVSFENQGKCFGHTLLSVRWFQYTVKPIKERSVEKIDKDMYNDIWGGKLSLDTEELNEGNIEEHRLARYTLKDDKSRLAVARLVASYHRYQDDEHDPRGDHNFWYNRDPVKFLKVVALFIKECQIPLLMRFTGNKSAHSVAAYRVMAGRAIAYIEGRYVERDALKICYYDPNDPASGKIEDDEEYGDNNYVIAFPGTRWLVGVSGSRSRWYSGYFENRGDDDQWWFRHVLYCRPELRRRSDWRDNEIRYDEEPLISDGGAMEIAGLKDDRNIFSRGRDEIKDWWNDF